MQTFTLTRREAILGAAGLLACGSGVAAAPTPMPLYRGVNLAGADFGSRNPGVQNTDYVYPFNNEVDYYIGKGMNVFRIPFKWERLQPDLAGPLRRADIVEVDRLVAYATGRGAHVVLDPHNYGRRKVDGSDVVIGQTSKVTSSDFARFWSLLAARYKSNPKVFFGLMNEPHDQNGAILVSVLNHAIRAIRATGARNLVLVPGNSWTGAHSWVSSGNAALMLAIRDEGNNFAFDAHQYLDVGSSGTSRDCVAGSGTSRLKPFTDWAWANGRRGFLGEFAGGGNAACLTELSALLGHLHANADVWIGWAYWAGGPWWGEDQYTIEPASLVTPVDRPQMRALLPFLQDA